MLARRAGETIKLVVLRGSSPGSKETVEKELTLSDRPWPSDSLMPDSPVAVPSLGVAYKVVATVRAVDEGGPAAKAKITKDGKPVDKPLAAGDEIVAVSLELPEIPEEEADNKTLAWPKQDKPLEFTDKQANWPVFMSVLQRFPAGTKVDLALADGRTAKFVTGEATDWYNYDRGFNFGPDTEIIQAHDFQQALVLGGGETSDALLMVYKFLRRLGGGQVSLFALGGPVTIATAAGGEASEGIPRLLLFLTMLSANLAVINFLPIPLLDGGHMVFLILEGIMRRPVSEKVVIAFHYAGFVFIISLMLFVLSLDVGLIPRF